MSQKILRVSFSQLARYSFEKFFINNFCWIFIINRMCVSFYAGKNYVKFFWDKKISFRKLIQFLMNGNEKKSCENDEEEVD